MGVTHREAPPGGRAEHQHGRREAGGPQSGKRRKQREPEEKTGAHHRVRESWMALVSAWPRCREPVTLGGGMHIMKTPLGFGADKLERYGRGRIGMC